MPASLKITLFKGDIEVGQKYQSQKSHGKKPQQLEAVHGYFFVEQRVAALDNMDLIFDVVLPDGSAQQGQITGVDAGVEDIFGDLQGIVDVTGQAADIGHQLHQVAADLAIAFQAGGLAGHVLSLIHI